MLLEMNFLLRIANIVAYNIARALIVAVALYIAGTCVISSARIVGNAINHHTKSLKPFANRIVKRNEGLF
jgi:hypothetical protein